MKSWLLVPPSDGLLDMMPTDLTTRSVSGEVNGLTVLHVLTFLQLAPFWRAQVQTVALLNDKKPAMPATCVYAEHRACSA